MVFGDYDFSAPTAILPDTGIETSVHRRIFKAPTMIDRGKERKSPYGGNEKMESFKNWKIRMSTNYRYGDYRNHKIEALTVLMHDQELYRPWIVKGAELMEGEKVRRLLRSRYGIFQ